MATTPITEGGIGKHPKLAKGIIKRSISNNKQVVDYVFKNK